MRKKHTNLSKEEKEYAIDCFHKGMPSREVGVLLNRSKTTILNLWSKHGLKHERIASWKIDCIKSTYVNDNQLSCGEIAKTCSVSESTVRKILVENNLLNIAKMKDLKKKEMDTRNEKIKSLYQEGLTYEEIAQEFDLSTGRIRQIIPKEMKNNVVITKEDKEYCIENYWTDTSTNIAEKLNISRSAVLKIWGENELFGKDRCRQYYCNFDYFNSVNTPEIAYWLGFIMADGCIYKRKGHQGLISITLQVGDKVHLSNFNNALQSNYPINIHKSQEREYCSIAITSDTMYDNLMKLGVKQNKTWKSAINLDMIPQEYWLDYCYGFFDGDGTITKSLKEFNSNTDVGMCGNYDNMTQIHNILNTFNIQNTLSKENRNYTKGFYSIVLTNMTQKYQFLKPYSQRPYAVLERKLQRAKEFVSRVENNKSNRSENIKAVNSYKSNSMLKKCV